MGNNCGRKEYEMKLDDLTKRLNSFQTHVKLLQEKNKNLIDDISNCNNLINELQSENKCVYDTICEYEKYFSDYKKIADDIISSDLNCKWMDDIQEKEYLIEIIKTLHNKFKQIVLPQTRYSGDTISTDSISNELTLVETTKI